MTRASFMTGNSETEEEGLPGGNGEQSRPELYEDFLKAFTAEQLRIMGYIWSQIPDKNSAQDVFQETTLALWKKFHTYRPEESFLNWGLGVARHQVLRYWRSRSRDRHVFSDELLVQLTEEGLDLVGQLDRRQSALNDCLHLLPVRQRELVHDFYGEGLCAQDVALKWGRTVHAVYKTLKVLRASLFKCVEQKLAQEI
ncbi:sigma-70 family RNA polymerase sigma factor [Planctomicrobium sp. SH661]|uniref:sigma-70 family RNA polymerase sigma factor n=1 Tax=Planctomicrobium sp. SH661 TaxID=3448124 RepID=UPI003F5B6EE3